MEGCEPIWDAAFLLRVGRLTVERFLLTVDNFSFLLTVGTFSLTILAFLLTVGALLLTVGKCVYHGVGNFYLINSKILQIGIGIGKFFHN